jgi:hypothetical protein
MTLRQNGDFFLIIASTHKKVKIMTELEFLWGEWFSSLFHLPITPLGAISVPGLLVCSSQAGLQPASGGAGALLFSQCNVAWRSFV